MKTQLHPKVALGVAAHPDDLDFGAAGTLAQWAKAGTTVYYLILTDGSKGSEDRDITPEKLTSMRQDEQRAAAKEIGAQEVFFLDYEDGALENTLELREDVVRYIRRLKPDVVVTMDPSMIYSAERGFVNHPDHRAAGQAALDAVFPLARDHLTFPNLLHEGLEPHKVATALLINFDKHNFCVDVTDTIDTKMAALARHVSQMSDLKATQDRMRDMAHEVGKTADCEYAEAFVRIDIR